MLTEHERPSQFAAASEMPVDSDVLEHLRALSASPYPPEPPRRSLLVDAVMKLSSQRNRRACITPHLQGGSATEKAQYEYDTAPAFWDDVALGIDALAGKDVLDIGCGWGGKAVYLAERSRLATIVGFDLPGVFDPDAATAFAHRAGAHNCTFSTGYAEHMPVDSASVDVASMDDVLEHVVDPERVLAECWRVLRPDGLLIAKFPSIRMMQAHHFDRVLTFPGLHYIASFKLWAGGLNDYLLRSAGAVQFEPFDEVVATKYRRQLTRNLNGLDFGEFKRLVGRSGFEVRQLELVPLRPVADGMLRRARSRLYRRLWSVPRLTEALSNRVVFCGHKRG